MGRGGAARKVKKQSTDCFGLKGRATTRPHGQAVKTPPSQGGIRSSILRGATINKTTLFRVVLFMPRGEPNAVRSSFDGQSRRTRPSEQIYLRRCFSVRWVIVCAVGLPNKNPPKQTVQYNQSLLAYRSISPCS